MAEVFLLCFLISTCLSLLLTPLVIRLAFLVGAVDKPDERKIHNRVMPRLGGLATFSSFALTLVMAHYLFPHLRLEQVVLRGNIGMIGISFAMILALGVCDDIWTLKAKQKFLVQFIAGSLVYVAGFRVAQVTNPFGGGVMELGLLSFPLTVLWMVGITNAFNLIDGLDGLASGIALIAGLSIAAISVLHQDMETAVVALTLVGAVFGFLKYNFNPAKIFLGDSGSLFLGFVLAVLSIESSTKGSTAFSVVIPFLVLGVPIMDTLLAMMRRVLRSFLPDQGGKGRTSVANKLGSMFLPDKRHIHHQLLARGFSHRDAVIVLYIVASAFGLGAFLVTAGSLNTLLLLLAVALVIFLGVRKLGYKEMAFIRNGMLLRFYSRAFLGSALPQVVLDAGSVFTAFLLAQLLTIPNYISGTPLRSWGFAALIVATIQLLAFILGGFYKRTISLLGLGDLLQILKSTLFGVVATAAAFTLLPMFPRGANVGDFILLNFYFLTTFVTGTRVIFHALNYVFHRESTEGKKAIIYGADRDGVIALQSLTAQAKKRGVSPAGFLDDDPKLEGKFLDGYPIYGGHWKLERLIKELDVSEVILAAPNINPLVLERIKRIALESGIHVRFLRMSFETVDVALTDRVPRPAFTIARSTPESCATIGFLNVQEEVE